MTDAKATLIHDKPVCGAKRRQGDGAPCQRPAGWGTDHAGNGRCKLHGGAGPSGRIAGRREAARRALESVRVDVDPNGDPVTELRRLVASLQASADYLSDRIGLDLVDDKGRASALYAMWHGAVVELRQALTALARIGTPDVAVTVNQGVPVDVVIERLSAAVRPYPEAADAFARAALDLAREAGERAE